MDVEQLENGTFSSESVSLLMLNELRMMRRDMNTGLMKLEAKVDYLCHQKKDFDTLSTDSENVVLVQEDHIYKEEKDADTLPEMPITRIYSGNRKLLKTGRNIRKIDSVPEIQEKDIDVDDSAMYTVHVDVSDLPEGGDEELVYEDQIVEDYNGEYDEQKVQEVTTAMYEDDPKKARKRKALSVVELSKNKDGRWDCDICSDSFSSRGNMLRHRRRHTGEKRYECSICLEKFFRKEYLVRHMIQHSDGPKKRYGVKGEDSETLRRVKESLTCEVCNRQFTMANNLKRHMRIHTGEKPYNCKFCDEKFSRDDFAKAHMKKVHKYEKLN